MNNKNMGPNGLNAQNSVQQNQFAYDTNIESTRVNAAANMNMQQNPYINQGINNQPVQNNQSTFNNADFIKGALIGAAATYLLTNKNAQQTIMKAFSKGNELFQAGMEELKERYEDAKAQMETQDNQ
ncbi:MAG: YtxH domain-containing protein [Halarcobacter sp.]